VRWAKVPDWVLDDLVAARGSGVAPGTALAGYVALALRADFTTGRVRATPADLSGWIGVTPRAARRVLSTLARAGAVETVDKGDLYVRAEEPADREVRQADLQVRKADITVRPGPAVGAGQPADPATPSEQNLSQTGLRAVEMVDGEQMELSPQRAPVVDEWLADRDARLRAPIESADETG
jgi:hypothetical protein